MANNINQVVDSLISINQVIENFRVQREKNELYDSNRFNPFQFLRTDEMGLSKILAFLLDPTETHGQGDLFLNSFLKFINKHQFLAYQKVNIYLEKITKEENNEKTNKNDLKEKLKKLDMMIDTEIIRDVLYEKIENYIKENGIKEVTFDTGEIYGYNRIMDFIKENLVQPY